jgi:putative FmdB family regulatory protein
MPIYEYRCESCRKISSFLLLRATEEIVPYCKACGGKEVKRQVSRVAILKGEEKMMESLLDPSKLSDLDENEPASAERVMRRMGRELGDELGEDFQESMEEALSGEAAPLEESL